MAVQSLQLPTGAALYDSDQVDAEQLTRLLHQGLAHCSAPMGEVAGREGVRVIQAAGRSWVWRHNRRGGWPGRIIRDSYAWLGEERTRSFQEWRLLQRARSLGLPVPAPIVALYQRHGLVYRSDIITELIPHATSLGTRLKAGPVPLPVWRAVGECIRRFHDAGFWHADLNVHNILLDGSDHVYLIDFDRGRIRAPGNWTEGNWSRLRRSLDKLARSLPAGRVGANEWAALRGA